MGLQWVRTGALSMWRVTHTPCRRQCSEGVGQEEPLRNVTAGRLACAAAADPAGHPRGVQHLFITSSVTRGLNVTGVFFFFVYLVDAMWDDSSEGKKEAAYVLAWGGAAASVWSGSLLVRHFSGSMQSCTEDVGLAIQTTHVRIYCSGQLPFCFRHRQ